MKFCLDDGAELVSTTAESEAPPTAVMSGSEEDLPETVEASTPVVPAYKQEISSKVPPPSPARSSLVPLVITVVVLLFIGAVILGLYMVLPPAENIGWYFLTRVARRLPMVLLAVGGIVFAIMRWKLHPRVSLMTVVALAIYLAEILVFTMILYWLPNLTEPMRMSPSASRWFYSFVYFIEDIVFAVTIILLVAAAFAGRKPRISSKVIS